MSLDNLKKEDVIKILQLNKIDFDPASDVRTLRKLAKENIDTVGLIGEKEEQGQQPSEEKEQKPSAPAIHKHKETESNMDDYRERLIDAGHEVISEEEAEEINETEAKQKESSTTEAVANEIMKTLLAAAGGAAGNIAETRRNELNKDTHMIEAAMTEDLELRKRLDKEPKLLMVIPIERNIFKENKSIMNKQAVMKDRVPMLINGNPVLKDVFPVELNGLKFTFDLGIDDGSRAYAYIKDVPWSIAKVIARSLGQTIQNPQTGESYTPPNVPPPPQNQLINGQIIQSNALSSVVIGNR